MTDGNNRDYPQVLKESYDQDLKRLRVDALINDGTDALVINADGSINDINLNKLIDVKFDDIAITSKNDDGNPLIITVKYQTVLVRTITLTYDSDGDLQRVQKT